MAAAAAKKTRCVGNYKNGNSCRAYAVHGYLCAQHHHLCDNAEVQKKIAEIERQNAERERQFNEILAQDAHTRLHAAPSLQPLTPVSYIKSRLRFTPYQNGLEFHREEQARLCHLAGAICSWNLVTREYPRSNLLCREPKIYGEVFPWTKNRTSIIRCFNPRVQGRAKCLPCRRETQTMHKYFRRLNEESGACEHGPSCWPSLDTVIALAGGRCYHCGVSVTRGLGKNTDACRDHYTPVSRGGLHCKDNAVLACRHCNGSKHDNMPTPPRETAASTYQRLSLPEFV